jgi:hypothetical protein
MIREILPYWEFTQTISETVNTIRVKELIAEYLDCTYNINVYKTSKDEVLQIFNDDTCYTFIGGSSADKWEWRSNFNWLPLYNGLIHNGFNEGAREVIENEAYIHRKESYFVGHSRGGAIASILCFNTGSKGVGFGSPKAFKRKLSTTVPFYNVYNPLDPVVHVVPFFRAVGDKIKYKFKIHPHTWYGRHIKESDKLW